MGYITQNLSSQEEIVREAYVSKAYVFGPPILSIVGLSIMGLVIAGAEYVPSFIFLGIILAIPLFLNGLIILVTTEIALTNQRVIMKWGLFRRHTVETFIDKIEGIQANQGIIGRILGYGSLAISGTGGGGTPVPGIDKPHQFRKAVNEFIQNSNS